MKRASKRKFEQARTEGHRLRHQRRRGKKQKAGQREKGGIAAEKWMVYWDEYSSDTYLYGSEISYHAKDDVEFHNALMPPGTVIKEWYSKTNYQAQRIEPMLPVIDGERRYRIKVDIECPEGEAWLVMIVFYDRYGGEAGSVAVRERVQEFSCPLKTYSYRMRLVNGGMTAFRFHSVVIWELEDEEEGETEAVL